LEQSHLQLPDSANQLLLIAYFVLVLQRTNFCQ
jgi:hypothetical protein